MKAAAAHSDLAWVACVFRVSHDERMIMGDPADHKGSLTKPKTSVGCPSSKLDRGQQSFVRGEKANHRLLAMCGYSKLGVSVEVRTVGYTGLVHRGGVECLPEARIYKCQIKNNWRGSQLQQQEPVSSRNLK